MDGSINDQKASGFAIAQAGPGGHASVTINVINGEDFCEALYNSDAGEREARLELLSLQFEITRDAVEGFLNILNVQGVPLQKYPTVMADLALRYKHLLEIVEGDEETEPKVSELFERARDLLRSAGSDAQFLEADELLKQAYDCSLDAVLKLRKTINAQQEKLSKDEKNLVRILVQRGELANIRLLYFDASEQFCHAAELWQGQGNDIQRFSCLLRAAEIMRVGGDRRGEPVLLRRGAELYRSVLFYFESNPSKLLGDVYLGLGSCLAMLGERTSQSVSELEEAISVFEKSSEFYADNVKVLPMTLHNIFNAKMQLATRFSGKKANTLQLEALKALSAVPALCSRESFPFEWAMAHYTIETHNIEIINSWSKENESILLKAVRVLSDVIDEFKKLDLNEWAAANLSKGTAYRMLAAEYMSASSDESRFLESVDAGFFCYSEAQKEWAKDTYPADWARVESAKAVLLSLKSCRMSDVVVMLDASCVFEHASTAYKELSLFVDWADNQNNLGLHNFNCGVILSDRGLVELSIKNFEECLSVKTELHFPEDYISTNNLIDIAKKTRDNFLFPVHL